MADPILNADIFRFAVMTENGSITFRANHLYYGASFDIGVVDEETDAFEIGVAIISESGVGGLLEFSTDDGETWTTAQTEGGVDQALIFSGNTLLRFTPTANESGPRTITFHAYDNSGEYDQGQLIDLEGAVGLSANTAEHTLFVDDPFENVAPLLDSNLVRENSILENESIAIGGIAASFFNYGPNGYQGAVDPDGKPIQSIGIAIIGVSGITEGKLEYSTDNGNTWTIITEVAPENHALVFAGDTLINYTPPEGENGTRNIEFHAWDGTGGFASGTFVDLSLTGTGGITPFSSNTALHTLTVGTVDDIGGATTGNDSLTGTEGNDFFNGLAGTDTLTGGLGDDTYIVNSAGDLVVEATDAEGAFSDDTVRASINYTLTANVEHLMLTGTAAISGTGTAEYNEISGNSAANRLSGLGGNDVLYGFGGNDNLLGDIGLDSLNGGIGNDTLNGGSENDTLNGGLGADSMVGGDGSDVYYVDNTGDRIVEAAGLSFDRVYSSINFTLGGNVEFLILTGNNNINGTGNTAYNYIQGNDKDNILSGGAFTGGLNGTNVDILVGGLGNDVYLVDIEDVYRQDPEQGNQFVSDGYALVDTVTEFANQGIDTLKINRIAPLVANQPAPTDITFNLEREASHAYIENIDASGITSTTARLNLTGNALDNQLTGSAGANALIGGDGNDTLIGGTGIDSFEGGAGDDTYFLETAELNNFIDIGGDSDTVVIATTSNIDLNTGVFAAQGIENVTITGAGKFNLTGTNGDNILTGNAGANILMGAAGINTLTGGSNNDTVVIGFGNDLLKGGAGDDTYYVVGNTTVEELASGGNDTVIALLDYTLTSNIEKLILMAGVSQSAFGNTLNNTITGNLDATNSINGDAGNDTIIGGSSNDTIDGGTGNDSMTGGLGDDTYRVDSTLDKVLELANGGFDSVETSVNYTLLNQFEQLTLLGDTGLKGTGNGVGNTITGGGGDDTLDGAAGADDLFGGEGNDTIIADIAVIALNGPLVLLDNLLDGGNGVDTLKLRGTFNASSALTFNLSSNPETDLALVTNFENLDASATGTSKLNILGNEFNNTLIGNAANNSITGGVGNDSLIGATGNDTLVGESGNDTLDGGVGNDSMVGGDGNDTYTVNAVGDTVVEAFGFDAGIDTVNASINYTLIADVENLTLVGTAVNGTGNDLSNVITGNNAANNLSAGIGDDILIGGAGNDTLDGGTNNDSLEGGLGNDVYVVDNNSDIAVDIFNGGIDTLRVAANNVGNNPYTLSEFIEHLDGSLTTTGESLYGNALNNSVTGGTGNDILLGAGGNDTLVGGAGNDYLDGNEGSDRLIGGAGNDTLVGGGDFESLIGGVGDDTYMSAFIFNGATSVGKSSDIITELAGQGTDTLSLSGSTGPIQNSTFTLAANLENLSVSSVTSIGVLTLIGNTAGNSITGNNAANKIEGLAGNDSLSSGGGSDTLVGGVGQDTLTGGSGNDTFVFKATSESTVALKDTITDFINGADKLDLTAIDANTITAGNQDFVFSTEQPLSAFAGKLWFDSATSTLFGYTNADATADFAVAITGTVVANDILGLAL